MDINALMPVISPNIWDAVKVGVEAKGYTTGENHIDIRIDTYTPVQLARWFSVNVSLHTDDLNPGGSSEEPVVVRLFKDGIRNWMTSYHSGSMHNCISDAKFIDMVNTEVFGPKDLTEQMANVYGATDFKIVAEHTLELLQMYRFIERYTTYNWVAPNGLFSMGPQIHAYRSSNSRAVFTITWGTVTYEEFSSPTATWTTPPAPYKQLYAENIKDFATYHATAGAIIEESRPGAEYDIEPLIEQDLPIEGKYSIDLGGVSDAKKRGLFAKLGETYRWQGTGEYLAADGRCVNKAAIVLDADAKTVSYLEDLSEARLSGARHKYPQWGIRWEKNEMYIPTTLDGFRRAVKFGRTFQTNTGTTIDRDTPDSAIELVCDPTVQVGLDIQETTPWVESLGINSSIFYSNRREVLSFVTDDIVRRVKLPIERPDNPGQAIEETISGTEHSSILAAVPRIQLTSYDPGINPTAPYRTQDLSWKYADPVPAWFFDYLKSMAVGG